MSHNRAVTLAMSVLVVFLSFIACQFWQTGSTQDIQVVDSRGSTEMPETVMVMEESVAEEIVMTDEVSAPVEVVALKSETRPSPTNFIAPEIIEPAPTQESIIDTQFQFSILTGHNTLRSQKSLLPLAWSDQLAASAQSWADNLAARGCILEHSVSPYGENLYYGWTTNELKLDSKPAVKWWAAEESFYDYAANTCKAGEQCGHYTQMVWEGTTEIGCAVSTCTDDGKNIQMWVCQYNPPGNNGDRPY